MATGAGDFPYNNYSSANTTITIGGTWDCQPYYSPPTWVAQPAIVYQPYPVYTPYPVPVETKKENIMKVFGILVVDKRECKILLEKNVVAKDRETAMLDLDLDKDIRDKIKKNEIDFIFSERGSFEKVERHAKVVEIKE